MAPRAAEPRSLVWTRAAADWAKDAPTLSELLPPAARVVRIPCIAVAPLPAPLPADGPWDYIAVTSRNAVRFAVEVPGFLAAARQARRLFTHGTETAAALTALGLAPSVAPVRTAAELCAWLLTEVKAPGSFLIPVAAEPAFDLVRGLAALGHRTTPLVCYGTVAAPRGADDELLTAAEIEALAQGLTGVVSFASPSAVKGFAPLTQVAGRRLASALTAVAIGPATAKAAGPVFRHVEVAPANTVKALVQTAAAILAR